MKTFIGVPGTPPAVAVTDDQGTRPITGTFAWGKKGAPVERTNLSKAILAEHLGPAATTDVEKLHTRFTWRVIVAWEPGQTWKLTGAEIDKVLGEIRAGETEIGAIRTKVDHERAPVANEGGVGPGGAATSQIEKRRR